VTAGGPSTGSGELSTYGEVAEALAYGVALDEAGILKVERYLKAKYRASCSDGVKSSDETDVDGGGWTLALKVDGAKSTFSYDAALWTNVATHNPSAADLDGTEAKLASFSSVPFTEVRAGFKESGVTSWLKLPLTGSSLSSVFSSGAYRSTSAGRTAWLSLMSGASIQGGCNSEGFNVASSNATYSRVRIGILGNNESDCGTCDSWMGIGGIFPLLGSSNVSCGVIHSSLSTQTYRPAMGYVGAVAHFGGGLAPHCRTAARRRSPSRSRHPRP
jgi:hypothetical protein